MKSYGIIERQKPLNIQKRIIIQIINHQSVLLKVPQINQPLPSSEQHHVIDIHSQQLPEHRISSKAPVAISTNNKLKQLFFAAKNINEDNERSFDNRMSGKSRKKIFSSEKSVSLRKKIFSLKKQDQSQFVLKTLKKKSIHEEEEQKPQKVEDEAPISVHLSSQSEQFAQQIPLNSRMMASSRLQNQIKTLETPIKILQKQDYINERIVSEKSQRNFNKITRVSPARKKIFQDFQKDNNFNRSTLKQQQIQQNFIRNRFQRQQIQQDNRECQCGFSQPSSPRPIERKPNTRKNQEIIKLKSSKVNHHQKMLKAAKEGHQYEVTIQLFKQKYVSPVAF